MSALVEAWRSELAKIRQRSPWGVGSKLGHQHKEGDSNVEEAVVGVRKEEKVKGRSDAAQRRCHRTTTLSEATVCMLMDRFAPC